VVSRAVQLEIFPASHHVEPLDPRDVIGPRTRVEALYRVRCEGAATIHQVFRDRHGWYCGEHGPACVAVSAARKDSE
jgi:hypothetical protein